MRRVLIALSVVAVLAGCSREGAEYKDTPQDVATVTTDAAPSVARPAAPNRTARPEESAAMTGDAMSGGSSAGAPTSASVRPIVATVPMLALSHQYSVQAPAQNLTGLVRSHERACTEAGPLACQVTGTNIRGIGRDQFAGELSLRATPEWINRFRAGLEAQVKDSGGRIVSSSTESEDLTRAVVDTEATVRAKTIMRGRLEDLLANRTGRLSDILEVEQQLARVQEEIDAMQSHLAVMRTRVATQSLTIRYASAGALAPEGVFSPLMKALSDVLAIIVGVFAGLIRLIAVLIPIGLVVWAAWIVGRPLWRRFRKPAPVADTPPKF